MNSINELMLPNYVPTREMIEKLQSHISTMPQVEMVTEHYFSGGMYCRKLYRSAGTLIVGKVHLKDHIFVCTKGKIIAWTENGMKELNAGDVIESKAGTKRVTLALEDSIGMTVHKTDLTNLDEIEKELIEEDMNAIYDSSNHIKDHLLEVTPCLG